MQRQASGQYTAGGQSAKCAGAIKRAAGQSGLPVVVEVWEEHAIAAGLKGYCVNVYYPDGPEGDRWIDDVIKPLLYKFSMGTWDLNRLPFPSWSRVEDHLRQRLLLRRGEAGSVTERLHFANFD